MKKFLLSFCFLWVVLFSYADHYKVLFIGNSYTEVNNLPQLISHLATSTGDTVEYAAQTPGGCTFQQHLTGALSLIRQGGWDYVVLQEQSQLPSFPESQFMSQCYPFATQLCDTIRKYNPEANIVFYMTWGRKNGDQQNCPYFPPLCTYEGMDSLLYERYMMLAEDNQAMVSPVGYVWRYIRSNFPDIELYQADESHPSLAGSYAAACTFYTTLFGKTPIWIATDENVPADQAVIIRDVVAELVFDSLERWSFLTPSDTTSGDSVTVHFYESDNILLYPNPVAHVLNIQCSDPGYISVSVYDEEGKLWVKKLLHGEGTYALPIENLPVGVFLLHISHGKNRSSIHKFIKTSE